MKNNAIVLVIVLLLAGAGIWYVSSQPKNDAMEKDSSQEGASSAMPAKDASGSPEAMMEAAKEVVVEAAEFTFMPAEITVKKGEKVKLVLKNTGKMTHDWVVDELGVRTKIIDGGTEDTLEFTPDKAGVFEYYCSVGKHRAMGMVGKITVTE